MGGFVSSHEASKLPDLLCRNLFTRKYNGTFDKNTYHKQ